MPIKFRCAYCNQLMGIARRKAGTVVNCPNCNGQVVVPDPALVSPPLDSPNPAADPALFQKASPLQTPPTPPMPPAPAHRLAAPTANMDQFDVQPLSFPGNQVHATALPDPPPQAGIRWVLVIIAIILVVIGFGVGFAVARLM
jgi:DNA-directed RNA polymerase subunit RPC12/RpoP